MSVPASIWQPPRRRLTLGLIVVVLAGAFESLAVATVLPLSSQQLGDLQLYGWAFSAFMLTNLVGITLGGYQSDQRGPAVPFVTGTLLFVAGLAASGLAPSMAALVAGRALQGIGAGLLSSSAYAAIALAYAVEQQPRMLATISSAWVLPGLLGPGVAGLVASHASWRWVFLGLVPLPLIACMLALPALRALGAGAKADAAMHGTAGAARIRLALQLGLGASAALASLGLRRLEFALPLLVASIPVTAHALRRLLPAGTLPVGRAFRPRWPVWPCSRLRSSGRKRSCR